MREVERIRGMDFRREVPVERVTPAQARLPLQRSLDRTLGEEKARELVAVLAGLGLTTPDLPLRELLEEVITERAGGFYDPFFDMIYMVDSPALREEQYMPTLVHEMVHALQDVHHDLANFVFGPDVEGLQDLQFARQALIEGEAVLVARRWQSAQRDESFDPTAVDIDEMRASLWRHMAAVPAWNELPRLIQMMLIEPYTLGYQRVAEAYVEAGWEGVDALWERPPISSEHLLHPSKREDLAYELPPAEAQEGERLAGSLQLGEFGLGIWLAERLETAVARPAAAGWAGDRVDLFELSRVEAGEGEARAIEGTRVVIQTRWDDAAEAQEFSRQAESWSWLAADEGYQWELSTRGVEVTLSLVPPGNEALLLEDDPWSGVEFAPGDAD